MKICTVFNIAPLYRKAIFDLMGRQMEVTFLFGERSVEGIAMLRGEVLRGFGGYLRNIYRGRKLVWQRRAIRLALLKHQYDCYILTGNPGVLSNWIIMLIARMLGRKAILWSHGLYGAEQGVERFKYMLYFRLASHIMLYGEGARRRMIEQGIASDKMTVVYNSLDYDAQLAVREKVGDRVFIRNYFGNDWPYVSYVGRLTPAKQLDLLLRALVGLECNLVVLGGGAMAEPLQALARELGIEDQVWFQGECYDEQLIGTVLYHSAGSASPSSIGLMAIHSLMFGAPIITHSDLVSQAPEAEVLEEGVTGCYFKQGDVESLRCAIRRCTDMSQQERNAVRQACYHTIESKYNPHVQIQIMRRMLDQMGTR